MNKITIDWYRTNWTTISYNEDTVFYAFTRGNNLIYIGIAYRQRIIDEVRNTLRRLNLSTTGMSIWLGYIDRANTTYGRVTQEIVRHAECLMIYMNQPSQNVQCMQNYTGRRNLRVVSRNLLANRISCDEQGSLRYT